MLKRLFRWKFCSVFPQCDAQFFIVRLLVALAKRINVCLFVHSWSWSLVLVRQWALAMHNCCASSKKEKNYLRLSQIFFLEWEMLFQTFWIWRHEITFRAQSSSREEQRLKSGQISSRSGHKGSPYKSHFHILCREDVSLQSMQKIWVSSQDSQMFETKA